MSIFIHILAYIPLFVFSAVLNLRVLRKLFQTKRRNGLSRLNQLLMHLVLADLSVSTIYNKKYLLKIEFPKTVNCKISIQKFNIFLIFKFLEV